MDNQPTDAPISNPSQPSIIPESGSVPSQIEPNPTEMPVSPSQEPLANPTSASTPIQPASSFPPSTMPTPEPEQPTIPQEDNTSKKKMSKKTIILIVVITAVCLLPIIALVVIMIGVALPNMQTAQRDTQRRNDYTYLSESITNYLTQHNGSLPDAGTTLDPGEYMTSKDPSGKPYTIRVVDCDTTNNCPGKPTVNAGEVYVVKNANCGNEALVVHKSRYSFAIWGYLEAGKSAYCSESR